MTIYDKDCGIFNLFVAQEHRILYLPNQGIKPKFSAKNTTLKTN